jgi:hypothetical protein
MRSWSHLQPSILFWYPHYFTKLCSDDATVPSVMVKVPLQKYNQFFIKFYFIILIGIDCFHFPADTWKQGDNIVAWCLKGEIVEPERRPLLGNRSVNTFPWQPSNSDPDSQSVQGGPSLCETDVPWRRSGKRKSPHCWKPLRSEDVEDLGNCRVRELGIEL